MATSTTKTATVSGFQYGPLIAGWLLPGAGHFLAAQMDPRTAVAEFHRRHVFAGPGDAGQALHGRT